MSDNISEKSPTKKLIFFNNKNKTILIIDGVILHDKFEAIVYLKPHMVLYGVVKMICINEDGTKSKYEVIGIDKLSNENYLNESTTAYKIYLSNIPA